MGGYMPYEEYVDKIPYFYTTEQLQQLASLRQNRSWNEIAAELTARGFDPTDAGQIGAQAGLDVLVNDGGNPYVWAYNDKLPTMNYNPTPSVSTNAITTRTAVNAPMSTSVNPQTGKVVFSAAPSSGSFRQNATYLLGRAGTAMYAATSAINLAKSIDSRLYNANPNFWDSIGLWSLNPETWSSIAGPDPDLAGTLFNFIFGIDAQSGDMQAYMDADAFSYMAYGLYQNGFFGGGVKPTYTEPFVNGQRVSPTLINGTVQELCTLVGFNIDWTSYYPNAHKDIRAVLLSGGNGPSGYIVAYDERVNQPYSLRQETYTLSYVSADGNQALLTSSSYGVLDHTPYRAFDGTNRDYPITSNFNPTGIVREAYAGAPTAIISGEIISTPIGITDQPGGVLPDTSTWVDIPSTDTYLRSAYPDMYNNAIQYDNVQPDGSVLTKTYIPVALPQNITTPDTETQPWVNPQPTSDVASQGNTLVNVATSPESFVKEIVKTLTQTVTALKTDINNPTTVGDGGGPPLVPIAGNSSALWSVYHPTKAQIDSFGAWLWTDNVIQQFIQLLNNPMEGIITLHKVFAPPVDSGSATIVVGRLDSEVPSATVAQQYVSVDCGSVDVNEYFGNVFDYPPFTTISLYLPFIGFVPLNPDDVMRSTVHIKYGVDVFTGACLAIVEVSRDGNTVGMYQYSGVASVEYPLTGAQHSGLVSGLLGVAGGIAGVALASTGAGIAAGAGSIAGGVANFAKSNPARSGGFSGNAGAMGVKTPYIIFERPLTKVAATFDSLSGYPTNYSVRLGECSGHVVVSDVHVHGINGTDNELEQIESLLKSGVIV